MNRSYFLKACFSHLLECLLSLYLAPPLWLRPTSAWCWITWLGLTATSSKSSSFMSCPHLTRAWPPRPPSDPINCNSLVQGRIHLVHLWICKYFTDDSSINFHDKFFLYFLLKFSKKWRKNLPWKFTDESSVKYLRIRKWTRWIRPTKCLYFFQTPAHGYIKSHFLNDNKL